MTWQTSEGDRWLTGAEAELVREILAHTVDQIADNIRFGDQERLWDFGVELFDAATPTQQLALANLVAHHLLTKTSQTPELTAVNEAAVYAAFRNLSVQLEIEIDTEGDLEAEWKFYWRRLTLSAFRECFPDDDLDVYKDDDPEDPWVTPASEKSRNLPQWDSTVESLADRILWDRDFEMARSFMDISPAKASMLKQVMGIETDYYSSIAPDSSSSQVESLLREVRQITHQKPR